MVLFLQDLIQIPSVNPPGDYERIAEFFQDHLRKLGLEVTLIRVPDELAGRAGVLTPRVNVLARFGGNSRPELVLNAHLDTVPPSGTWTTDPFAGEIRDGRVFGRGAIDSKGRLASYVYAVAAVQRAGFIPRGSVVIAATADEESGGALGAQYLLDAGFLQPDFAIVEGSCYVLWIATNGCLHLRVVVHGIPAHASMPEQGRDALETMSEILSRLYAHRDELKKRHCAIPGLMHPTLVVGTIEGGTKTNTVPDWVTITIDRRINPGEDPDLVAAELDHVVESAAAGADIETKVLLRAEPAGVSSHESLLIQSLLDRSRQVADVVPALEGTTGFTDARFFWEHGIDTVHFGPSPEDEAAGNIHGADENLAITDLLRATEVLALAILDIIGEEKA
jgi:succinyl-diaminopimelate desuccinylase